MGKNDLFIAKWKCHKCKYTNRLALPFEEFIGANNSAYLICEECGWVHMSFCVISGEIKLKTFEDMR